MAKGTPTKGSVTGARILMDAPRREEPQPIPVRELTPSELLQQPTMTLSKILGTLDVFVDELRKRSLEGSVTLKDVRALTDLVRAHAVLRQTQLAEDQFARQTQTLATDTDVAMLLIEAVKAGGPQAQAALHQALLELPPHEGDE